MKDINQLREANKKFDETKTVRAAFDYFKRIEIEKIINEGILKKKDEILHEVEVRWNILSKNEKKEFEKLEKLDKQRFKKEQELKKKFEEIKKKRNESDD